MIWTMRPAGVFPAPRRAPVAVIWRPSKNWKMAATKSKGMVAAMTAGSSVKELAMRCGKRKMMAEKQAMAPAPRAMAAHPAEAASPGALRPMAWATRTAAAAESAKETMKVKLAQLRTIAWPARGRRPIVAMRKVAKPKMEISTKI